MSDILSNKLEIFDELVFYEDLIETVRVLEQSKAKIYLSDGNFNTYLSDHLFSSISGSLLSFFRSMNMQDKVFIDKVVTELIKVLRKTEVIEITLTFIPEKTFLKALKDEYRAIFPLDNFVFKLTEDSKSDNVISTVVMGQKYEVTFTSLLANYINAHA